MSLKADILEKENLAIVSIEGKLSYENQEQLCLRISNLLNHGKEVVVDMAGLDFVGSSGITSFLLALKKEERLPKFCNVSMEFQRIMAAYNIEEKTICKSRTDAIQSFFRTGDSENN